MPSTSRRWTGRKLKRAGFEDRGGEEWAPPVCPAETKIATFRADEPVSWHELTDRARHMSSMSEGSVVRGETAYKTTVGHKVTGPELVWTMRDEFAKATMQTGCSVLDHMIDAERAEIAQRAYAMADAMIKAREKKP